MIDQYKNVHAQSCPMCQNMVIVMCHKGVLMKGPNRDSQPNMAILAQNWAFFQ